MVGGRPVVLVRMVSALAYVAAGSSVAVGQIGLNVPGITLETKAGGVTAGLSGLNASSLAAIAPTSLGLTNSGISAVLPGISVSNLAKVAPATVNVSGGAASVALPSVNVIGLAAVGATTVTVASGTASVTLPGVSVAGLAAVGPTSVNIAGGKATVGLPDVNLAGLTVSSTPLGLNLAGQGPLVAVPAVNVTPPTLIGASALNQVSPVAQLFANIGVSGVLAPVDNLLGGLAFADLAVPGCAATDSGALTPLPVANIWLWNASTIRSSEHDGYQVVRTSDADNCGSSLPMLTLEKTNLPGILWDASSAFGLKRGTLHLGFTGGPAEMDTHIKASAMLREAGFARAGAVKLDAWSAGAFSLLTSNGWYAGSAFGGAWGRTESQDFVVGSASDFDTSTFVAAGLIGTVVPLNDALRFDVRGTLTYQRTVGEAHADTLGIVYGNHTIEGANAVLSGRLFGLFQHGEATIRPFLQAGVTRNLHYNNQLTIDGVAFSLEEADTSFFFAGGVDLEMSKALQLSLGARQDYSGDAESFAVRFGLSARLN